MMTLVGFTLRTGFMSLQCCSKSFSVVYLANTICIDALSQRA